MSRDEFKLYIESIGFLYNTYRGGFKYKRYLVYPYPTDYNFYNGSKWISYNYYDLTPLKKIERSYKLKKILE